MKYDRERLKWNGWGWKDKLFDFEGTEAEFWKFISQQLGIAELQSTPSLSLEDLSIPKIRLSTAQLNEVVSVLENDRVTSSTFERVFHAVGKSYHDLVRIRNGLIKNFPDAVVYPEKEEEILQLIQIAEKYQWALIPFGGGTSVVGGTEADAPDKFKAIITVDMTRMNRIVSIDEKAMIARVQAGMYGPNLESELQKSGYTLGHYPQSFEFSTVGGWIAARGSGQQSNRYGSAARFMVGARVVTPNGVVNVANIPNSSSGPDIKHLIAGSEGIFGFITEVSVVLHKTPKHKDYRSFMVPSFSVGIEIIKEIVQSKYDVAMLRLSDEFETEFYATVSSLGKEDTWMNTVAKRAVDTIFPDSPCVLMVGIEGNRSSVLQTALLVGKLCLKHKGVPLGGSIGEGWYETRFETPYLRDKVLDQGVSIDTLETATIWSNIPTLYKTVREAIQQGVKEFSPSGRSIVLTHISHTYKTGASLYFSFLFETQKGEEMQQWSSIKRRASDAIVENGGTISHHHGVGIDHREWLGREKGELAIALLTSAKESLDPNGIMNPDKIISYSDGEKPS
jgi:alkyldihydroxyacetonephosphate synthase